MSTPVSAIGASEPVDHLTPAYHPAFKVGAKATQDMLRARVRQLEDVCYGVCAVLGLPEDTNCEDLPVLVEALCRGTGARSA